METVDDDVDVAPWGGGGLGHGVGVGCPLSCEGGTEVSCLSVGGEM